MKRLVICILILVMLSITITIMIGLQGILSRGDFKKQVEQNEELLNTSLANQKVNKMIISDTNSNTNKTLHLVEKHVNRSS